MVLIAKCIPFICVRERERARAVGGEGVLSELRIFVTLGWECLRGYGLFALPVHANCIFSVPVTSLHQKILRGREEIRCVLAITVFAVFFHRGCGSGRHKCWWKHARVGVLYSAIYGCILEQCLHSLVHDSIFFKKQYIYTFSS